MKNDEIKDEKVTLTRRVKTQVKAIKDNVNTGEEGGPEVDTNVESCTRGEYSLDVGNEENP